MKKKKILWIGDAVTQTGFARVTHNICERLNEEFELHVLGLNYLGDPHPHPLKIYPAVLGGDAYGLGRVKQMVEGMKPDAVVILNDPWCVRDYLKFIPENVPVIAYMPVDAPNQNAGRDLNSLARAIMYTEFGRTELQRGGFQGRSEVIPHGVDLSVYTPFPKVEARGRMRFVGKNLTPKELDDLFIVGCVNRNTQRKRLDLTIMYWSQWWFDAGQPDNAILYLHCSNRDSGIDVLDMAKYFGIQKNFCITDPNMNAYNCVAQQDMRIIYSMFDVLLSTAMGEGWGLTTHEAMACGVAPVVPEYSALAEWGEGAMTFVPVTSYFVTPDRINTIGGIPDKAATVAAIDKFYNDRQHQKDMAIKAFNRATDPRFNWDSIAAKFATIINETVDERKPIRPVGLEAR